MFYEDQELPHCLSRGFAKGAELRQLTDLIDPAALESLMDEADYATFAPELERRAHTFISKSIRGDFSKYTGPYGRFPLLRAPTTTSTHFICGR